MIFLKQSTASQSVLLGPFIDDTDGATAETALTIANTDIRLSANGGNMAAKNSGGGTHDEAGWYTITLDATDTATVGSLQVSVDVAGALPVFAEFHVLEEAIYDALFAASAAGFDSNGRVDVGSWLGTAVTTSATSAKPEVDVNSISDDATAADNLEATYDGTGYANGNAPATQTQVTGLNDPTAATIADAVLDEALSGHTTAGTLGKAVSDIEADTDELQGDDVPGLIAGLNDPTAATIADAVLDEALSGHATAGTLGKAVTDIEADTNELQGDDVPGLIATLNDISVSDVLTTQMTEAYAADGTAPTLTQALMIIQQTLTEFAIAGTTLTAKKLDGSTTAATFTLDDATNPTSITRTT